MTVLNKARRKVATSDHTDLLGARTVDAGKIQECELTKGPLIIVTVDHCIVLLLEPHLVAN